MMMYGREESVEGSSGPGTVDKEFYCPKAFQVRYSCQIHVL